MLLQETLKDDAWKRLVSCVLLNITTRKQVDGVIDKLFERFPNAVRMQAATDEEIGEIIRPCGLWRKRADTLRRLSGGWTSARRTYPYGEVPAEEVARMPGVGPYALDSYRWFVLDDYSKFESGDKELAIHWLEKEVT
jgi:methyl-CpG-binding domain protein 4